MVKKEIEDSVLPEHVKKHLERISIEHSGWYFRDIKWVIEMMLDFAQKAYEKALVHGGKHGYEAAMQDLAGELNKMKERK